MQIVHRDEGFHLFWALCFTGDLEAKGERDQFLFFNNVFHTSDAVLRSQYIPCWLYPFIKCNTNAQSLLMDFYSYTKWNLQKYRHVNWFLTAFEWVMWLRNIQTLDFSCV
jgi:hypothetical protein